MLTTGVYGEDVVRAVSQATCCALDEKFVTPQCVWLLEKGRAGSALALQLTPAGDEVPCPGCTDRKLRRLPAQCGSGYKGAFRAGPVGQFSLIDSREQIGACRTTKTDFC
jgi:hypothetical protein